MGFQNTNPIIAREIQRKGGRVRVKKGFGVNPDLAKEAGRKGGVAKRDNNRSGEGAKQTQSDSGGDNTIRVADFLGDLNEKEL